MGDELEATPLLATQSSLLRSPSQQLPWDPVRAQRSGLFVLVSVAFERLAYYAVIMNLFLYLNKGQAEISSWDPIQALTAVFIVNGVSYLSAPFGGWLSDAWIGRYWAIIIGKILYLLGFILLTALAANKLTVFGCDLHPAKLSVSVAEVLRKQAPCSVHVYVILILIGIGVGCVRANIPPFGAEQVRASDGNNSVQKFFTSYYWCINVGGLIGVGLLAYVEQNISNGFFISYLTATVALLVSLTIFAAGRKYYVIHRPGYSVISSITGIVVEGVTTSCRKNQSLQGSPVMERRSNLLPASPSWIDRAKISYGGSYHDTTVEDVKKLSAALSFLLLLIPFWLVYFQMSTSFQAQGLHMRVALPIGNDTSFFNIPAAWLTLFDQIFVLGLVPVLNCIAYPLMERRGISATLQTRIALGMAMSFLAVFGAAILEHVRLETWAKGYQISQNISGTLYNASDISILWQIPQYCLVGAAEVFAGVAGLEFAYSSSPRSFQGIVMGLYSALEGIGSFAGILLVYIVRSLHLEWIPNEDHFNEGHIDYYFYFLSVIQALVLIVLLMFSYLRWRMSRYLLRDHLHHSGLEDSLVASALHSEYGSSPDTR